RYRLRRRSFRRSQSRPADHSIAGEFDGGRKGDRVRRTFQLQQLALANGQLSVGADENPSGSVLYYQARPRRVIIGNHCPNADRVAELSFVITEPANLFNSLQQG